MCYNSFALHIICPAVILPRLSRKSSVHPKNGRRQGLPVRVYTHTLLLQYATPVALRMKPSDVRPSGGFVLLCCSFVSLPPSFLLTFPLVLLVPMNRIRHLFGQIQRTAGTCLCCGGDAESGEDF